MLHSETQSRSKSVALFYNDLAPTYDHEQFQTAVSMSKRKEYELFSARLPERGGYLKSGPAPGYLPFPLLATAGKS
jgi:hypothetical protein